MLSSQFMQVKTCLCLLVVTLKSHGTITNLCFLHPAIFTILYMRYVQLTLICSSLLLASELLTQIEEWLEAQRSKKKSQWKKTSSAKQLFTMKAPWLPLLSVIPRLNKSFGRRKSLSPVAEDNAAWIIIFLLWVVCLVLGNKVVRLSWFLFLLTFDQNGSFCLGRFSDIQYFVTTIEDHRTSRSRTIIYHVHE